jgi:electron transfer flavoprotein-quinone oxidoreductase
MDLAVVSGVLAAQTILEARKSEKYSAESLATYAQSLKQSAIYQDLTTFQHIPEILSNPRLFEEYPEVASELLQEMLWVDDRPKRKISSAVLDAIRSQLLKRDAIGDLWRLRKI